MGGQAAELADVVQSESVREERGQSVTCPTEKRAVWGQQAEEEAIRGLRFPCYYSLLFPGYEEVDCQTLNGTV